MRFIQLIGVPFRLVWVVLIYPVAVLALAVVRPSTAYELLCQWPDVVDFVWNGDVL